MQTPILSLNIFQKKPHSVYVEKHNNTQEKEVYNSLFVEHHQLDEFVSYFLDLQNTQCKTVYLLAEEYKHNTHNKNIVLHPSLQ